MIVDEEDKEVLTGETGELIVSGPNVMQGYFRDPERTAEVLKAGWFYTGDLGCVDEDGFYRIVGRKKELIIVSGDNVYPSEIDEALLTHPEVLDAAAVGVPDTLRGERVKAFVVRKPGSIVSERELVALCRDKLSAYKVPKDVEFIDQIPRNATGKVLRWQLSQRV